MWGEGRSGGSEGALPTQGRGSPGTCIQARLETTVMSSWQARVINKFIRFLFTHLLSKLII